MERLLFASRWLMLPFYCGLIIVLLAIVAKYVQDVFIFPPGMFAVKDTQVIIWTLSLIDLLLAGNLLIIVMFASYENFVSKIDVGDHEEKPSRMGKVDFGGLKLKLVASIVAISAIQLLKTFMDIAAVTEAQAFWQVVVHLTFGGSGVLLALMD